MPETVTPAFDSWAVVELFGHTRLAGRVTEQTIGGSSFLRLDVPEQTYEERRGDYGVDGTYRIRAVEVTVPPFTKYLTQGAIYSMTPCSEEVARKVLASLRAQPIQHVELATVKALPAPEGETVPPDDGEADDPDFDDGGHED